MGMLLKVGLKYNMYNGEVDHRGEVVVNHAVGRR
jgi:hypothetical protein